MNYRVTYFICPEKFTTILDFLIEFDKHKEKEFDHVIMHCGIVDFSPRPLSNIEKVKESKQDNVEFKKLIEFNKSHYENPSENLYFGEKTNTIYSLEYLNIVLGEKIKKIENFIWINSNNILRDWDGNFKKGRPLNINESVDLYEDALNKFIKVKISLKNWREKEIKDFTIDNIHFSKNGFKEISRLLIGLIEKE